MKVMEAIASVDPSGASRASLSRIEALTGSGGRTPGPLGQEHAGLEVRGCKRPRPTPEAG